VTKAPAGKARGPAGSIHLPKRGDDRDGGTSGIAKDLWMGGRQSSRSIGAMAATSPTAHTHANTSGHRQPGETCARKTARPGSQGTNAVHGTWCSEGDAGRPLRTMAGQAGTTPAGPGTPSPVPISLRLERIATQARAYPDMACTTLAHHLDVAMLACAFRRLNPHSALASTGSHGACKYQTKNFLTQCRSSISSTRSVFRGYFSMAG
jgi:hypothetical protein